MSDNGIDDILDECHSTGLFLQEPPLTVNDTDIFDDTPLHLVTGWGDVEAVAKLVAAGAKVNARGDKGMTPLFYATSIKVADLLLTAGVDPTVISELGGTAEKFLRNIGYGEVADYIAARATRT
ncbi:ankyrin repeat domain-containing protein [Pelagibius marinus]|uniref:ankyrin repeat domain-containing protein n=1 Tax=Pelagibius marinus TaxID=2762760 RepID=UPI0018725DD9|nr:ankyrin repeat domain-containing protein [Pelagibius marinus]